MQGNISGWVVSTDHIPVNEGGVLGFCQGTQRLPDPRSPLHFLILIPDSTRLWEFGCAKRLSFYFSQSWLVSPLFLHFSLGQLRPPSNTFVALPPLVVAARLLWLLQRAAVPSRNPLVQTSCARATSPTPPHFIQSLASCFCFCFCFALPCVAIIAL